MTPEEHVEQLREATRNPTQTFEQSRDTTRVTYRPFAELQQMLSQAESDLAAASSAAKPMRIMRAALRHAGDL